MNKIITLFFLCLALLSCKENTKNMNSSKEDSKLELAMNLKTIEVEIEGMTCEIGCARLIQSKLSKVEGVTFTNVNFESRKGQFTFDSNKLSKELIVEKISKIAGGDLYSVSKTTEIDVIMDKSSNYENIIE